MLQSHISSNIEITILMLPTVLHSKYAAACAKQAKLYDIDDAQST
jgi:hypothetical protein